MPNELRRPLRFLVVEHEPEFRDMFISLLEWRGYGVHAAASGAEALAIMRQHAISVALVAIELPDMSGYEVAATIQAELGGCAPNFIAVSSYHRPIERARAAEAGFMRHLLKPTTPAMLYNTIDTVS